MRPRIAVVLFLVGSLACGGESFPGASSVAGTWIGDYTSSASPGSMFQGVLQLTQSGTTVTGTLTTNAGRSANVSATLNGLQLSGTLTYTDACTGSATTTADIVQSGSRLTGSYSSTDCLGPTTGGYSLVKQ
jgi:hypothetical protein